MIYHQYFRSIYKKYSRRTNNFIQTVSIDFINIYGYNGYAV